MLSLHKLFIGCLYSCLYSTFKPETYACGSVQRGWLCSFKGFEPNSSRKAVQWNVLPLMHIMSGDKIPDFLRESGTSSLSAETSRQHEAKVSSIQAVRQKFIRIVKWDSPYTSGEISKTSGLWGDLRSSWLRWQPTSSARQETRWEEPERNLFFLTGREVWAADGGWGSQSKKREGENQEREVQKSQEGLCSLKNVYDNIYSNKKFENVSWSSSLTVTLFLITSFCRCAGKSKNVNQFQHNHQTTCCVWPILKVDWGKMGNVLLLLPHNQPVGLEAELTVTAWLCCVWHKVYALKVTI